MSSVYGPAYLFKSCTAIKSSGHGAYHYHLKREKKENKIMGLCYIDISLRIMV